jgi:membrane associated rhomboid family serine protease
MAAKQADATSCIFWFRFRPRRPHPRGGMSWIKRLERFLEPVAVPNLTLYLVAGQTFFYLTFMLGLLDPVRFIYVPELVLEGQVWRLVTFVFMPPATSWIFIAFALYFLFFTGRTLEEQWGVVRYNLFVLTGYVLTVGLSFITPGAVGTNVFIAGSIFLAFAYLYPDFVLYIFLILPVKIKWMALVTWVIYAYSFFTGGVATKLSVVASVGNFLLFFGRDLWLDAKTGRRRMQAQAARLREASTEQEPRHRCHVCGKDSNQYPQMDFRYCSQCAGDQCYCPDHIRNHVHVTASDEAAKS